MGRQVIPGTGIKRVLVEQGAESYSFTSQVLDRLPRIPSARSGSNHRSDLTEDEQGLSKETLYLVRGKGRFLKPCPGTKRYICCGYQILNVATNCPLDCSYCILQAYFNQPYLRVFVNLEEQIDQVLDYIEGEGSKLFRVGTGEFTDSLALDPVVRWTDLLLPRFCDKDNAVLELKTKTDRVGGLLSSKYRDRIIVSWSLNSPFIVSREEHKTAGLKARLKAAARCQAEGFVLGFHLDPLIPHPRWKEEYLRTLDLLDKYVDPKRIIWVSLGAFRFMPHLKPVIRKRHPGTCVLDGEFITGLDGKMRHFKPIRIELYAYMREKLTEWHPDCGLYLCMEADDVWRKGLGWSPKNSPGLRDFLDNRVKDIFG